MAAILSDFAPHAKRHTALREAGHRWVTELDKMIVGLCRPDRLLDLARRFTLFDKGVKKVARYPQVSAVYRILERIEERDEAGRRKGGVIWHTQGSGKSLTMVMLARALAFQLKDSAPRIVIVTDRRDLDRQIKKTFAATGFEPAQARTGEHLMKLIEDGAPLVTTLVNKFRSGVRKKALASDSADIFVLVDESHRSQYGNDDSMHEDIAGYLAAGCGIGIASKADRRPNNIAELQRCASRGHIKTKIRSVADDAEIAFLSDVARDVTLTVGASSLSRGHSMMRDLAVQLRKLSAKAESDKPRNMAATLSAPCLAWNSTPSSIVTVRPSASLRSDEFFPSTSILVQTGNLKPTALIFGNLVTGGSNEPAGDSRSASRPAKANRFISTSFSTENFGQAAIDLAHFEK
jgi:type I restriction enzyme R subunit